MRVALHTNKVRADRDVFAGTARRVYLSRVGARNSRT